MIKIELAEAAAQELLDRRFAGGVLPSELIAEEFWCSAMRKVASGSDKHKSSSVAVEPVCGKLRTLFDAAAEPMPDALASLFDRLDTAFERGELFAPKSKPPRG